jgi:hypothetical protein
MDNHGPQFYPRDDESVRYIVIPLHVLSLNRVHVVRKIVFP